MKLNDSVKKKKIQSKIELNNKRISPVIISCGATNLVTWINILLCAWNCWIDLMFLIEQANIKDMIACTKLGGKFILLLNLFFVINKYNIKKQIHIKGDITSMIINFK